MGDERRYDEREVGLILERVAELTGPTRSARDDLETCHLVDLASDVGNERVILRFVDSLSSFIVIASV